jgi:hypothetical protein
MSEQQKKNEDGRIVEHWGVAVQLAVMAKIGALPRPPRGEK